MDTEIIITIALVIYAVIGVYYFFALYDRELAADCRVADFFARLAMGIMWLPMMIYVNVHNLFNKD